MAGRKRGSTSYEWPAAQTASQCVTIFDARGVKSLFFSRAYTILRYAIAVLVAFDPFSTACRIFCFSSPSVAGHHAFCMLARTLNCMVFVETWWTRDCLRAFVVSVNT